MVEKPWVPVEQQEQKVETGKPIEHYQWLVEGLKAWGKESLSVATLSPLLKAIDSSDFWETSDQLKRELFDEIRQAIKDVMEPVKSELLALANELEVDNTDIPDGATEEVVAEFMNADALESIAKSYIDVDMSDMLPEWVDDAALKLFYIEQKTTVFTSPQMQKALGDTSKSWTSKIEWLMDEVSKVENDLLTWLIQEDQSVDAEAYALKVEWDFNKILGKWSFDAIKELQQASSEKIVQFTANLKFLKENLQNITDPEIDFSRTTVIDYIADIKNPLNASNAVWDTAELIKLSHAEYDRDAALQDKVADLNKIFDQENVNPDAIKDFADFQKKVWNDLSEVLINLSNTTGFWAIIAKIFESIWFIFWPEFQEAISETNLRKQKALFNLVKISSDTSTEWFKIDGVDFSEIKGDELKQFFAVMDSHSIKYEDDNFWEHLMTGEVDDGSDVPWVDAILEEFRGGTENPFTKASDFGVDNEWFKVRLNAIQKKEEVVDAEGYGWELTNTDQ